MKTTAKLMSAAFALSLAGVAPAVAQEMGGTGPNAIPPADPAATTQLVAQAGLDPADAAGMSLDEITAVIFDQPMPPVPGGTDAATVAQIAGIAGVPVSEAETLGIDELTAAKFDIATVDALPAEPAPGTVPIARIQLIAGSGLPAEAAAGLSLDDLVAIHLDS
jgi:hypothetical protein